MTAEEANKIIATYMGWKFSDDGFGDFFYLNRRWETDIYSESLDALVSVWDKFEYQMLHLGSGFDGDELKICFQIRPDKLETSVCGLSETIQEAACIATAKAIKELE